jgi:hypothetical protein
MIELDPLDATYTLAMLRLLRSKLCNVTTYEDRFDADRCRETFLTIIDNLEYQMECQLR